MQTPPLPTPPSAPGPSAIYEALTNQREVLGGQLRVLEEQRSELNGQLQRGTVQGASKAGVENRIVTIDKRIEDIEKQIAGVDAQVAQAAAVPGALVPGMGENLPRNEVPEEAFVLGALFMIIVFLPISIAFARRIWKRSTSAIAPIPPDLTVRLARIEQAVETSAVEIERIGEGQRFITKLFTDSPRIPALPSRENKGA